MFQLLLQQLKSKHIGILRRTCKELLELVSVQTTHIHTERTITSKRAADLLWGFPNIVSLSYHRADETTYHLARLTSLTSLTLSAYIPWDYPEGEEHYQSK